MNRTEIKDKLIHILSSINNYSEEEIAFISDKINEILTYNTKQTIQICDQPIENDLEFVLDKLKSPEWQEAVDPNFLCDQNSSEEKMLRARAIISTLNLDSIPQRKILDYGCGEGHVVHVLANQFNHQIVVGFDIKEHWKDDVSLQDPHFFTTDIDSVLRFAPYDVVCLYDVIDHLENKDTFELLSFIRDALLRVGGQIKIRLHPWYGRHGGHHFHQLNKSYVHLMLNKEEMESIGIKDLPHTNKIMHPREYEKIINALGMKIVHKKHLFKQAGPIFETHPRLKSRLLARNFPGQGNIDYSVIETTFDDYWLEK